MAKSWAGVRQETAEWLTKSRVPSTRWPAPQRLPARRACRRCILWNPPFCGDIDMRIAADGTWFYMKTPIGRPALVKLFSSVLWREGEKYFLVTPVEKIGITVDDAPFTAVEMAVDREGPRARSTSAPMWTSGSPAAACTALRFEPEDETGGLKPYLHVRRDLWALVTRALFYDLVELGEERDVNGIRMFGVASGR